MSAVPAARSSCLALLLLTALAAPVAAADGAWQVVSTVDDTFTFTALRDGVPVLSTGNYGWGPGWSGLPGGANPHATKLGTNGVLDLEAPWCNGVKTTLHAGLTADGALAYHFELTAEKELPVMMLETGLTLLPEFQKGHLVLTAEDGKQETMDLPWPRTELRPDRSKQVRFTFADAGDVVIDIEPACRLHPENNNLRIALAADKLPAGTTAVTITYRFPGKTTYVCDPAGVAGFVRPVAGQDWFPLTVSTDPKAPDPTNVATDMSAWLDAPAGKHGGVQIRGDHFELKDGTPIKFWGTNLAYAGECAPEKSWAEATAKRLARAGINAVRMHKFTDPAGDTGISDPQDATRLLAAGMDRLDYMCAQLKQHGIYYGFSHTYHFTVQPGNASQLLDYAEIKRNNGNGDTYGMINYAEDVQDLLIARAVTILNHQNPYTGTTYASDPAFAYIELQNEDDIFFWTSGTAMDEGHWPHYMAALKKRFAAFLTRRYATQAALAAAWQDSLKGDETLAAGSIRIQGNPWFFTPVNLKRISAGERRRMLDNAAFLHEVQDTFYSRYVAAIRATGYAGPICGSPWQAPAMLPAYDNLLSDASVGYIDRHNYFGGGLDDSMMGDPGGGYLATGLQRVQGLPFGISEWITGYPSLYSAEGPALFAAYGMGLQDWNASYEFQSSSSHVDWANEVGHPPWGVWNADIPSQVGQAVTLARMIYRGDVTPGKIISVRHVTPKDLAAGDFDFSDDIQQQGDVKTFGGSCPPAALAVGRCLVDFSPTPAPSIFPKLEDFRTGTVLHSTTGQLAWDSAGRGCVSIDTPGTTGVIDFAPDRTFTLGAVTITLQCPYASLMLTAAQPKATLADASTALISAFARSSNRGCTWFTPQRRIIDNGGGGVLMEPVKARIHIAARTITAVNVLDHVGARTGTTIPVTDGTFTIDGARDHAFYYEVVFAAK